MLTLTSRILPPQSLIALYQENHLVCEVNNFPSDGDFDALAAKCGGLFIFAGTLMRFIKTLEDQPHRRLKLLCSSNWPDLRPALQQIYQLCTDWLFQSGFFVPVHTPSPPQTNPICCSAESAWTSRTLWVILGLQSVLIIPGELPYCFTLSCFPSCFLCDPARSGALLHAPLSGPITLPPTA